MFSHLKQRVNACLSLSIGHLHRQSVETQRVFGVRTVGGDVKAGEVGELKTQVLAQRRQVQVVQRLLLDLRRAYARALAHVKLKNVAN